jgi:ankyrin repeat protein
VHILVDALDECEDNSQREIIKQLAVVSLFQEDIPVRVYISCRPTTTAAKFLNKPDFDSPHVKLLEIMQAQLRHDITIYVNSWIDKFIAAGVVNRENAQTLAVMLTDKAEGTFIWLAAAAEVLLQESAGVGFGKLKENVQKLPANLRSLYISRLNKFNPEHKVVFGNVFRVLRASYGKRTWEEINLLVTIRPEHRSVADIREKSEFEDAVAFAIRTRNLVNSHEGRVSFLHSTLKDALEDFPHLEMDRGMRPFQSDERDCHHFLAERCMRFLIMPDIKRDISMLLGIQDESSESSHGDDDHSDLSDSGEDKTFTTDEGGLWLFNDESPNEEATLHGPLKVLFDDMTQEFKILPLFAYAATSWWKHFRACLTDDDQTLRDVAWSLLQSPNEQHWYQYLQAESKSTRNSGAGSGPEFPDNPAPLTLAYCLGFTSIVENRSEKVTSAGLRWATRNGHLDCVMVWLDKAGSDLEWNNDRDLSRSLFEAADRGHTDIFKALLQVGSSAINDRHERGMTPLAVAIAGDHSSIVTSILGLANAELNASDSHQMTPIFLANTKDIFSQLRTDPRTNIKHLDKERRNVLLHACASGKLTIVKLLIKEGTFDINSQDKKGKTPLMCAVCAGHLEIVRFLLRQGNVDVNKLDVDDRNAISWAAGISNPKILKCLCDKDPSGVNVQDRDGYYPLDWTLYPSVNEHNARLLLKLSNGQFRKEAGLRTFNHTFGYSALSIAVMLISENWLDVNAVSDEGRTALSYACEKGPKSLISLILMVPELNPNLIGNTTEHLEEILVKREGSRKHLDSSEIVPEIRKLIHERRRA